MTTRTTINSTTLSGTAKLSGRATVNPPRPAPPVTLVTVVSQAEDAWKTAQLVRNQSDIINQRLFGLGQEVRGDSPEPVSLESLVANICSVLIETNNALAAIIDKLGEHSA